MNLIDKKESKNFTLEASDLLKDLELDELTDEITSKMSDEEIQIMSKRANPYSIIEEGKGKFVNLCYTNVRETYYKRLILTSLISFINRAADEWGVPEELPIISVEDYLNNPEILNEPLKNISKNTEIKKDIENLIKKNKKLMEKRIIVREFLEHLFQFNPDKHVSSSYKPSSKIKKDLIFTPVAKASVKHLLKRQRKKYNSIDEKLLKLYLPKKDQNKENKDKVKDNDDKDNDEKEQVNKENDNKDNKDNDEKKNKDNDGKKNKDNDNKENKENKLLLKDNVHVKSIKTISLKNYYTSIIPSDDIYFKFNKYYDANYEKLIDVTNRIYSERPDISFMLNILNCHDNVESADLYKKRHADKFISSVLTLETGKWNIIGPYEKNKDAIQMYGDNAYILEEMLKQKEMDSKLGIDLMKKRVIKKKKENIKKYGSDDKGLSEYKNLFGKNSTYDIKKEELKLNNKNNNDPEDAIEVDVYNFSKGGLNLKKTKFYTKAEAPVHMLKNQ